MRKITLVTLLFVSMFLTTALLAPPTAIASHAAYDARNCTAAGQGPGCADIYYEGGLGFAFHETWDPSWDYETLTGSLLGGPLYDIPVIYSGLDPAITGLATTSAIASIDIANGTYYQFTINTGIHARRLNGTTPVDLGVITSADWAYAIQRSLAVCDPIGPAATVYPFIKGAYDWFYGLDPYYFSNGTGRPNCLDNPGNQTALAPSWATLLSYDPIGTVDADTWYIRVDADFNPADADTAFFPFLGVLANSWAAVYSMSETEAQCGVLATHLAMRCAFADSAKSIGTGPYLLDETETTSTKWVLRKNANYCEGGRASLTECNKIGTVAHSERVGKIVITEIIDETSRADQMYTGLQDHSIIAPVSLPRFLEAATTPVFNALKPEVASEFDFRQIPSLTTSHMQLLTRRTTTGHTNFGFSPLEGACSPTPSSGCLVRQAIIETFNYNNYLNNILLGLYQVQLATFMPDGFPSGSTNAQTHGVPLVTRDTKHAASLILQAGYNATSTATKLPAIKCAFNLGNDPRARSCISLANDLESLRVCNPAGPAAPCGGTQWPADSTCTSANDVGTTGLCTIVPTVSVETPPTSYVGTVFSGKYDIAGLGWFPDYVDEDDYARPYAHSAAGFFSVGTRYNNATLNALIDTAAATPAGTARDNMYFEIERTINDDCKCFIWLNQPSGRSVWNRAIDNRVFDRLLNPAFLYYYLDIHKIPFGGVPVFGNVIDTVILMTSIAAVALVLLRRTSTRRILPKNLV